MLPMQVPEGKLREGCERGDGDGLPRKVHQKGGFGAAPVAGEERLRTGRQRRVLRPLRDLRRQGGQQVQAAAPDGCPKGGGARF